MNKKIKEKESVEKDIYKSLADIQKKLNAPKKQFNKFAGFNYRSCEDILEAVKPLLGDCVLLVTDEIVQFKSDNPPVDIKFTDSKGIVSHKFIGGDRFYIKATAKLSNGEDSVESVAWARESDNKKGMDESQITGATSSYARKYALNGLFAIDDAKDADHGLEMVGKQATAIKTPHKATACKYCGATGRYHKLGCPNNQK